MFLNNWMLSSKKNLQYYYKIILSIKVPVKIKVFFQIYILKRIYCMSYKQHCIKHNSKQML